MNFPFWQLIPLKLNIHFHGAVIGTENFGMGHRGVSR